ncbi:MAG: dipicolinate synthase subunit DpsA [Clostridia bacterium]|nr:dipicolinate synthase subunit DpsA [Clostridia bacterium]
MVMKRKFGIIGGDFRQIHLAEKILMNSNKVFLFGFDKLNNDFSFPALGNIYEVIDKSEYIILPLPETRDGIHLFSPFSTIKTEFSRKIFNFLKGKVVFGDLKKFTEYTEEIRFYDYAKTEEFQIMNAVPTAEGAIKIALDKKEETLFGKNCLIAGFGRIGKLLANRLKSFGAYITTISRNPREIAWAKTLGYRSAHLDNLTYEVDNYDLIFNTIPSMVFTKRILSKCKKDVFIIDVASNPGGIDKDYAKEIKINCIHALGIPGNLFPKSASDIIYNSIQNIIQEENL